MEIELLKEIVELLKSIKEGMGIFAVFMLLWFIVDRYGKRK